MRNLDTTMAPHLADGSIMPAVLVELGLRSGVERVWSGIGNLVWSGKTFTGVGNLGSVGAITEASAVKAEGTTVTLSGIGLSSVPVPALGFTPPSPPFTPPAGQSVAWAVAKRFGPAGTLFIPASIWTGGTPVTGSASASATSGSIAIDGGCSLPPTAAQLALTWSDFELPPEIPPGAEITGVYALIDYSAAGGFGVMTFNGGDISPGGYVSPNLNTVGGQVVGASAISSLEGGSATVTATSIFIAVYYVGSPSSTASLVYEALNDVRLGAPVKIWFGLMAGGAFIGSPYLVFSGTVDKPTVTTTPEQGTSITLALENRLVNLQRATNRRFTAADQRLSYPTDIGFNWVEILNDIALVWGN